MDDLILRAARLAKEAHTGQFRKYHGRPYIEHPARVAARVMLLDHVTAEEVAAALLHDVLEDCDYTADDLAAAGMPPRTIDLVLELTDPSKLPENKDRSRRERKQLDRQSMTDASDAAKRIKLCDVIDNLRDVGGATDDFRSRFVAEKVLLLAQIGDADPELTELAFEAIDALGLPRTHTDPRVG